MIKFIKIFFNKPTLVPELLDLQRSLIKELLLEFDSEFFLYVAMMRSTSGPCWLLLVMPGMKKERLLLFSPLDF